MPPFRRLAPLMMGLAFIVGCAPSGQGRSDSNPRPAADANKTLVFVTHTEPTSLSSHRASAWTGSGPSNVIRLFNATLSLNDITGASEPYLQESLPTLNSNRWKVFPDGKMETTHVLRPGLTWHDGAPVVANDFIFSWKVNKTPELAVTDLLPAKVMEEVVASDDRTLVVRWNGPYPLANDGTNWYPLPSHILEPQYNAGPLSGFAGLPYWTREYVGTGPYKLDRWEPGAFLEASAFAGHALGAPKIAKVKAVWMGDPNTAVANLLAGDAHVSLDRAIEFEQGVTLKRQWSAGRLHSEPGDLRYLGFQLRADLANPQDLLDPRVRRGLAVGLNKQQLIDAILDGEGKPADTMLPPYLDYYATVDKAITKHTFDQNRAHQLLAEAGLSRGSDGAYSTKSGERFSPELRALTGGQTERESILIGESWRAMGIDVRHRMMSQAEDTDREVRSTYPAFSTAKSGSAEDTLMNKLYGANTPLASNRWTGTARTGWINAEFDKMYLTVQTSLSRDERNAAAIRGMQIVNEELPLIPLYHDYGVMAFNNAVVTPDLDLTRIGVNKVFLWSWK
jgi:peptide/nickel transport system substrate-binding protein